MSDAPPRVDIRPFHPADREAVRDLFIRVNRSIAPLPLKEKFEAYIARSLAEEIDRVAEYYGERKGGFWVAESTGTVVGMFGLEPDGPSAMELRRMYVAPEARRRGVARQMLVFAEDECRRRGLQSLTLSTSELQGEALALYRAAGYRLQKEEIAETASNKTLGGGIRRYHFDKAL
jgi:ribosomal protein S18 acetylase RimI-like enzyme